MEAQLGAGTGHQPFPLPQIPSLNNTYGAILIGTFGSLMLYGLTIHQAYRYTRVYHCDSMYTKCYVPVLVLLDTLHTVLCIHMTYWYLVVNHFRPERLFTGIWSINLLAVTLGVNIICCQCFFARRVYIIGHKWRIMSYRGCWICRRNGFRNCRDDRSVSSPDFASFHNYAWMASAAYGIAVFTNVMLTTILTYILHESRTGFSRTETKIDRLIKYAVCTGFITDIFSIFVLVFALVQPGNLIYSGIDLVTSKLYVNSVLAALNFREPATSTGPHHQAHREISLSVFYSSSGHVSSTGVSGWRSGDLQDVSRTHSTVLDINPELDGPPVGPSPFGLATPEGVGLKAPGAV
ncbi:hypothetical protein BD413DRAFT_211279 [Trametes elegans]|nr:hypothetical protein BD413DRAFT_211279 [Trametes elegans]